MNNKKTNQTRVARLESKNDLLETELNYIHNLLCQCGFPEGIKTLKETALELLNEQEMDQHQKFYNS